MTTDHHKHVFPYKVPQNSFISHLIFPLFSSEYGFNKFQWFSSFPSHLESPNNFSSLTLWKEIYILGTVFACCVKNHYFHLVWNCQFHLMPLLLHWRTMVSPHPCHMFFRSLWYPSSLMKLNNPGVFCPVYKPFPTTDYPTTDYFFSDLLCTFSIILYHYWRDQNIRQFKMKGHDSTCHDLNHYNFWFAFLIVTENWADVFYHVLRS